MARRTPRLVHTARRAFTLIELLVVVGIIGVLVGLTLFVGTQVVGGGKQRTTQQIIQVLDQAMQTYITSTGDNPTAIYVHRDPAGTLTYFPIGDVRDMTTNAVAVPGEFPGGHPMVNAVGMFYEEARTKPEVSKILDKIPQQYVRMYDIDGTGPQPALLTVFDAWGKPIRYVHPTFQGVYSDDPTNNSPNPATARPTIAVCPLPAGLPAGTAYSVPNIRRNNVPTGTGTAADNQPDGDGGMCVGHRPYFYSLGPDGLCGVKKSGSPGTVVENYNADNIYTTIPNFVDK
ncbi:MAG TPA: prepilin-type N-terminal cleavage/methylation domain-containing protein [Phycisphaerales bacterium]|nr:prepilin-type N-terminal cleavage/methylation domain-containing protein [Phycisphaerales bacterium]